MIDFDFFVEMQPPFAIGINVHFKRGKMTLHTMMWFGEKPEVVTTVARFAFQDCMNEHKHEVLRRIVEVGGQVPDGFVFKIHCVRVEGRKKRLAKLK